MYPHQLTEYIEKDKFDKYRQLPLHFFLSTMTTCKLSCDAELLILKTLLNMYPEGASISFRNRLPLHLALERKLTWKEGGVADVLYAYPGALQVADEKESGLLPFMIAAKLSEKNRRGMEDNGINVEDVDVTTIYHLLREDPTFCELK